MAAPVSNKPDCWTAPEVYKHHEQRRICISRPKYREGRKDRAVKVYTINLESCYVMVQGVPAIGVMNELIQLCALYGTVEEYRPLDEYPAEQFTEVYLVKFQKITSARAAKRHMDEKSFYGGVLHVCYVPEYETVEDTRLKLLDRRKYIIRTVHNIARQKRQAEDRQAEDISIEPTTSKAPSPPKTTTSKPDKPVDNNPTECSKGYYSSFPLLPLPPQEYPYPGYNSHYGCLPTEDKMGTLHNAIVDTRQQQSTSSLSTQPDQQTNKYKGQKDQHTRPPPPVVRFLPRTTQLEKRKRNAEEDIRQLLQTKNVPLSQSGAFIGPKLPEPPKLDMEDSSLNTTVNLIRSTMKQVESVPEVKPVEKKVKPRRRI